MITLIKEDLLDSDLSMCLGLLMSYKVPEDPLIVINKAQKIRNAFLYAAPYESESPLMQSQKEEFFSADRQEETESLDAEETSAETNSAVKRASAAGFDPLSQISCNIKQNNQSQFKVKQKPISNNDDEAAAYTLSSHLQNGV